MTEVVKKEGNKFPKGVSGNPAGRPKGSKNKVTLLRLMAEEAVRDRNLARMQEVAELIIEQALEGDRPSQKLVWASIISNSNTSEQTQAKEKFEINVNAMVAASPEKLVDGVVITTNEEDTHECEEPND